MKETTREEPKIVAAAEHQMQTWVHQQASQTQDIETRRARELAGSIQPYVAISRETGAGGSRIARALGERLGWDVLDRSLLDRMAERFHLSHIMLRLVDEAPTNWVRDVLGTWMDRRIIPTEKYLTRMTCVVLAAARQASIIAVGRGMRFLLPPEKGLSIRVVAPLEYRLERVMERERLGESHARYQIEQRDRGRREFVARHFHRDVDDPLLYDLVVNVERLGHEGAVRQIVTAMEDFPL